MPYLLSSLYQHNDSKDTKAMMTKNKNPINDDETLVMTVLPAQASIKARIANAANTERLMAAAPDMLTVLEDLKQSGNTVSSLLGTVGELTSADLVALLTEYGRRASAVITKATGRHNF